MRTTALLATALILAFATAALAGPRPGHGLAAVRLLD